ncbi:putative UBP1-associated protein 2C-like [Sesbania bispinosa]|nr:putative UBP1-associated protein 2C-like [Sesbania bispinosa]
MEQSSKLCGRNSEAFPRPVVGSVQTQRRSETWVEVLASLGSFEAILPSSGGMQAGGYPGGGHYSLLASSGYQNQHHLPAGASSPVPRVPPGSM